MCFKEEAKSLVESVAFNSINLHAPSIFTPRNNSSSAIYTSSSSPSLLQCARIQLPVKTSTQLGFLHRNVPVHQIENEKMKKWQCLWSNTHHHINLTTSCPCNFMSMHLAKPHYGQKHSPNFHPNLTSLQALNFDTHTPFFSIHINLKTHKPKFKTLLYSRLRQTLYIAAGQAQQ